MNRLKIWVRLLYWFLTSLRCNRNAHLLTSEETTDLVCKNRCSLIRLGDGELNSLEGINVHYQHADENLKHEMEQLIEHYIQDPKQCKYLLCMPNEFLRCNGLNLIKKRAWVSSWARFRYVFMKYFDVPLFYGDAFLFAKGRSAIYEKIWEKADNIIFVHNDIRYAEMFAEEYRKNVTFLGIPPRDCYAEIDIIVEKIRNAVQTQTKRGNTMVLVSAGPCAKVIVFRLKDLGVQIIDTGHCWDEPLHTR